MATQTRSTLGDLISLFYEEFMELYGDAELASVATAAVINDLLADAGAPGRALDEAA